MKKTRRRFGKTQRNQNISRKNPNTRHMKNDEVDKKIRIMLSFKTWGHRDSGPS